MPEAIMNEMQQIAFNLFLDSANAQNDFTPLSESRLVEELHRMGFKTSTSSVNRWKEKFKWREFLEQKINMALVSDKGLKKAIVASSLDTVVRNTQIDLRRNSLLLSACYEIGEHEIAKILEKSQMGERLNKEDFNRYIATFKLLADRDDKMLDRLANMSNSTISSEEVLEKLNAIEVEVESEEEDDSDN